MGKVDIGMECVICYYIMIRENVTTLDAQVNELNTHLNGCIETLKSPMNHGW